MEGTPRSSPTSRPWNEIDRESTRAVVLDANAFSGASFSRHRLEGWAREAEAANIEIWLPEVVVWELASHSAELYSATRQRVETARQELREAGLDVPEIPTRSNEDVLLRIEEEIGGIGPPVRIVECRADLAMEGLKDQVLGRPPAERVKGVKTGAADGTWLRAVLDEAGDTPEEAIVIVSNDGGVVARIEEWDLGEPIVVRSWGELREGLFNYREATAAAIKNVLGFLIAAVRDRTWEEDVRVGHVKATGLLTTEQLDAWGWMEPRQVDVEVTGLTAVVGVRDLKVEVDEATATADVYLQAELFVTGWFDDPEQGLVPGFENLRDVVVRVPLVFALEGSRVLWVASDEDGIAFASGARFDEEEEALQEVLWTLSLVPGVAGHRDEWSVAYEQLEKEPIRVDLGGGRELTLSLDWSHGDEWSLSAAVDTEFMELRCAYDHDAWVGGADGFHIEAPWVLTVSEGQTHADGNPLWALSALLIRILAS